MHQLQEKQRIATTEQDDDADVFGYHFESGSLAVNLFHLRNGKIVDRREFFWEDLAGADGVVWQWRAQPATEDEHRRFNGVTAEGTGLRPGIRRITTGHALAPEADFVNPGAFFSALLKQLYIDQPYVPRTSILVPRSTSPTAKP